MATKKKMLQAAAGSAGGGFTAIEDVFSTYLYTGNGSTQTITNGIDLAGEGGLVWIKARNAAINHYLYDTERGATKELSSNLTDAEATALDALTSFNSDGFSLGADNGTNKTSNTHASWTFRKAPRFFDVVTYTGAGEVGQTITHNLGVAPGMVIIKDTSSASNWYVYHRSLASGGHLKLNKTDAVSFDTNYEIGKLTATDTEFSIDTGSEVDAAGNTYVAYLFAHDPLGPSEDGSDGLIACGSYTGNGSSTGPVIDLGWEPQWVMIKCATNYTLGNWLMLDTMRGWTANSGNKDGLYADLSGAEIKANSGLNPTSTGFQIRDTTPQINGSGNEYIYIAIRRGPMRAPESGTEVFATEYMGETLPNPPQWNSGFPVDWGFYKNKDVGGTNWLSSSRLTQGTRLAFNTTAAESALAELKFDYMDGWQDASSVRTDIHGWMFRRAPSFFDVVAYTGDGAANRTVPHSLGVAPELVIVKNRDQSGYSWIVGSGAPVGWNYYLRLDSNTGRAFSDIYFANTNTPPTDSGFYVGRSAGWDDTNRSPYLYIAYLFATLAGVSKVGSYTGNGSSQTIDCGFTTGARFILIKRTNSTGDWYVWDTARGVVAANDPHLSLNTTAAEVTTDDSVDPDSSGFIVNQVAATNINVSSASYIYLAIS